MARRPPVAVVRPLDPADPWGAWELRLSADAVDALRGLAGDDADRAPGIVAAVVAAGLELLDPDDGVAELLRGMDDGPDLAELLADAADDGVVALVAELDAAERETAAWLAAALADVEPS